MKEINLEKIKHVHFIGIGGIGVSALARMMLGKEKQVSGSDASESRITEELAQMGARVAIGHRTENISEGTDLVIYTIAVLPDNPELVLARERGIPAMSYPEFLGLISKDYFTIAISGTHGKTTTTAMISDVLSNEGINPTVIVGSLLKRSGSNFLSGMAPANVLSKDWKNGIFLVEACEYRRSFLNLSPVALVITNIDNDHLDYYRDVPDIISAFRELAMKVPESGIIIANLSDERIASAVLGVSAKVIDYSSYDVSKLKMKVAGEHTRQNAKASLTLARALSCDMVSAGRVIEDFSGTWRRFEYKGKTKNGVEVYDDYGHHPTEVRATLAGTREKFPGRRIVVVFQPHLYSRTKLLLDDFAAAFSDADKVILAPIYAAREPFDPSITSEMLADRIGNKAVSFQNFSVISDWVISKLSPNDVLITMGAGDVYKVGEALVV